MKKVRKYKTDFLVPSINFLTGFGSIFNLAGNYFSYNYSKSGFEADTKALQSDWGVVGQDLEDAIDSIKLECKDDRQLDIWPK